MEAKWGKNSKTYKIDYVRIMRMMGCEKLSFHVCDYISARTRTAFQLVCVPFEITNVPFENNISEGRERGEVSSEGNLWMAEPISPLSDYIISLLDVLCIHLSFDGKCRFQKERE